MNRLKKSSDRWTDKRAVRPKDQKKAPATTTGTAPSTVLQGVAPTRDFWQLFVSNLKSDSTSEQVKVHLHRSGIEVKDVFIIKSKNGKTVSAKVRVALEHKERAKAEQVWPKFVKVSDWIFKPKVAKTGNTQS